MLCNRRLAYSKFPRVEIEGPHRKRQARKKGDKAIRATKKIQDAYERLAIYQGVLDTKILIDLGSAQCNFKH